MTDGAIMQQLGKFVQYQRRRLQRTQQQLAHAAGISRSTLSALERGETTTLNTLIRVLRVLDQLPVLQNFSIDHSPSPMELLKLQKRQKQRIRTVAEPPPPTQSDW